MNWKVVTDYLLYSLLPVMLILVIGIVVCRVVIKLVNKILEKSHLEKAAHSLIKATVRTVLYGLLALMVASR